MLRLLSLSKTNQSVLRNVRSCTTVSDKESQFLWRKPLEPRVQSVVNKYPNLTYSSFLEGLRRKFQYRDNQTAKVAFERWEIKTKLNQVDVRPIPLALRYLQGTRDAQNGVENDANIRDEGKSPKEEQTDEYETSLDNAQDKQVDSIANRYSITSRNTYFQQTKLNIFDKMKKAREDIKTVPKQTFPTDWMVDYETFDEEDYADDSQFGTPGNFAISNESDLSVSDICIDIPDPTIPISNVPCYGCGSNLQCADHTLPGYLPSELMRGQHEAILRVCE